MIVMIIILTILSTITNIHTHYHHYYHYHYYHYHYSRVMYYLILLGGGMVLKTFLRLALLLLLDGMVMVVLVSGV